MNNQSVESLLAQLETLRKENDALRAAKSGPITFKVGKKGTVTVFGLTQPRFAPSLYPSQWQRLMGVKDALLSFIENNKAQIEANQAASKVEAPVTPSAVATK